MRSSKLTADQIFEAEKAADDRKNSRAGGFAKMKERDRGWAVLTPLYGSAKDVTMEWRNDSDQFQLTITPYGGAKKVSVILEGEEFRKWLRWV